jgi:hypothetical protein
MEWLKISVKLEQFYPARSSYLATANIMNQVEAHKVYISIVTENSSSDFTPEQYLLSAKFIANYKCHEVNFIQQLIPYVSEAWYCSAYLQPLVAFLEKICAPRNSAGQMLFLRWTTVKKYLPSDLREKIFLMAEDDDKQLKSNTSIELLLHWMFHIWGFAYHVPQRHKLIYNSVDQVEKKMALF